jgi:hypothetical protein
MLFTLKNETQSNLEIENKEIIMETPEIVTQNETVVIDNTLKLNELSEVINRQTELISALTSDLESRKNKEIENEVKTDLKELATKVHIDSENIDKLNESLLNVRKSSISDYKVLVDVITNLKPKAPLNEFKPANLDTLVKENTEVVNDDNKLIDTLEKYAEANNIDYNEAFDLYCLGKIEIN